MIGVNHIRIAGHFGLDVRIDGSIARCFVTIGLVGAILRSKCDDLGCDIISEGTGPVIGVIRGGKVHVISQLSHFRIDVEHGDFAIGRLSKAMLHQAINSITDGFISGLINSFFGIGYCNAIEGAFKA